MAASAGGVASSTTWRKAFVAYAWILVGLLVLLAAGWVYGLLANPTEITSRPVRLAYLACDAALVIPVGLAAGLGLLAGKDWARTLFALALGLLLFDTAHGVIYLVWDNYFHIPLAASAGILAAVLAYVVLGVRALIRTGAGAGAAAAAPTSAPAPQVVAR